MAACVAVSGCGVGTGREKVEDAKEVKRQVEKEQQELEKELNKGQ
jgi:hypothetical protein